LFLLLLFGVSKILEIVCPSFLAMPATIANSPNTTVPAKTATAGGPSGKEPQSGQDRAYNGKTHKEKGQTTEMNTQDDKKELPVIDDKKGVKPKEPPPNPPQRPKETENK
jgi:hypothetical protein